MINAVFALMAFLNTNSAIPLDGNWQFALDPDAVGEKQGWYKRALDGSISLPTTADVAGKSIAKPPTQDTWHLTPRYSFEGQAWYRRTVLIPKEWADRPVTLYVERTKSLTVYVDGGAALDGGRNLSTSHRVLLGKLTPGEHTLALRVDNKQSLWPERVPASHMLEGSTQSNWNGVLGRIELQTEEQSGILGVRTNAVNGDPRQLGVKVYLDHLPVNMNVQATLTQNGKVIGKGSASGDSLVIQSAKDAALWDEFHPQLCQLDVTVTAPGFRSSWQASVGLRDFRGKDGHLFVNGRRTFLRGKHDACVFPLTGHPPMDDAGWRRYFSVVKAYGLNHVRFHSWCPPEAAFRVADAMGIYLQPEMPFWGDPSKPGVQGFVTEEGRQILREFGHHPSFVMLSLGNEYWGAPEPRGVMVSDLRAFDPTRMYAQGSNSESWNPREFVGDDYRTSTSAKKGEDGKMRGSNAVDKTNGVGYIQVHVPGTSHDYSLGLAGKTLPFISHEVGQYEVFPNFKESAKYTGLMRADNFDVFKERLAKAGMLDQAEDFRLASGRLAVQCYREEIEAALRTPDMDGFQLLDLQDYPGQGTALVGIVDAFMDSKGLITEADWRSFCSELVPLALFPKHTWRTNETFIAEMRVANYGANPLHIPITWEVKQGDRVLAHKTGDSLNIPVGGVTNVGMISLPLNSVSAPARLELSVNVGGKVTKWPLWVYAVAPVAETPGVTVARKLDTDTMARLTDGGTVLYIPSAADLPNSLPGFFTPDFWNFGMFKGGDPPGTMGLLIQDKHPALAQFPTRSYTEWQWQDLAHHSRAVILDKLPGYKPIVQPIDNFDRNQRLGTIFELKVGKGKLLVCAIDLLDDAVKALPEATQLMRSLTNYAGSARFLPTTEVKIEDLNSFFGTSK